MTAKSTKTTDKNNAAFAAHATKSNGRNALPVENMGNPALVERAVENSFPFELEFGNDSILIKTVSDEGFTVPILVGAKIPGLVHGILNATTAIWKNSYPVFEVGYMYLHRTLDEARETLADDNVGYVFGCPRLVEEVNDGKFKCPPRPIKMDSWYRIHWDTPHFSLWEVVEHEYAAGEPEWREHDRNTIRVLNGMEWIYKAVTLGQSIRCHVFAAISWMYQEKVDQYNLVLQGKFVELKNRVGNGIAKKQQYSNYQRLVANPEKVERIVELYGTNIKLVDGSVVDASVLVGHKIKYYRNQTMPVGGALPITTDNLKIMIGVVRSMYYLVEIIE